MALAPGQKTADATGRISGSGKKQGHGALDDLPMATSTIHCGTSDWISRYWAVSAPMKIWSMSDLTVPSHSDILVPDGGIFVQKNAVALPVASRFLP